MGLVTNISLFLVFVGVLLLQFVFVKVISCGGLFFDILSDHYKLVKIYSEKAARISVEYIIPMLLFVHIVLINLLLLIWIVGLTGHIDYLSKIIFYGNCFVSITFPYLAYKSSIKDIYKKAVEQGCSIPLHRVLLINVTELYKKKDKDGLILLMNELRHNPRSNTPYRYILIVLIKQLIKNL